MLDIEFYDVKVKINDKSTLGIEGEARKLRYEVIKKKQKGVVALGHHQNDQAETLMMHLLRGSGLKGLSGMPEFDLKRKFWRPMLNIKKDLLEKAVLCIEKALEVYQKCFLFVIFFINLISVAPYPKSS